jgi:putative transposase
MTANTSLRPGAYYHIFQRGNNRENIFLEKRNYAYFMKLYAKYITPIADTFVYCLLKNRVHFLVRIRKTRKVLQTFRVSRQFGNLFNAYAKAFNKRYNRMGSLFQKPFGRVEVTSDSQFTHLVTYIHHNPQHHGLIDDFRDWPYSSYAMMLSDEPTFVCRDEVIEWYGGREAFISHHHHEPDREAISAIVRKD